MTIRLRNHSNRRAAHLVGVICAAVLSTGQRSVGAQVNLSHWYARPLTAVRIPAGSKPPMIDGNISDAVWKLAPEASNFLDQQFQTPARDQTTARILYNDKNIYVAFHCTDSHPDQIVARETVRDGNIAGDDNVTFDIDPMLVEQQTGVSSFSVNPLGTESTNIAGGTASKLEWEGKWKAAAKRVKDGWTAEMLIPWRILALPPAGKTHTIGINFERYQVRTRGSSIWSFLGIDYLLSREGRWNGVMVPASRRRPSVSVLPYLLTSGGVGKGSRPQLRAGLDARFKPTPQQTLAATINPDFQDVEGQVASIAFTRGGTYLGDNRPFFSEGSLYYDPVSPGPADLFYSTAIGAVDVGEKYFGQLNKATSVGLLATQAPGRESAEVASVQQNFGPAAGAAATIIHDATPSTDNTVIGASQYYQSGKWSVSPGEAFTFGPQAGGHLYSSQLGYSGRHFSSGLSLYHVGSDFHDSLGFVSFTGYQGLHPLIGWFATWRHGPVRTVSASLGSTWSWHVNGEPFQRNGNLHVSATTWNDYFISMNAAGGMFDKQRDLVYALNVGAHSSDPYNNWSVSAQTGTQADKAYTSVGPDFNARIFRRVDVSVQSFFQLFGGLTQQHILSLNYLISPTRSVGGRAVLQNGHFNFYLQFHNAGGLGTNTFLIVGDPNAQNFVPRVALKLVFAL